MDSDLVHFSWVSAFNQSFIYSQVSIKRAEYYIRTDLFQKSSLKTKMVFENAKKLPRCKADLFKEGLNYSNILPIYLKMAFFQKVWSIFDISKKSAKPANSWTWNNKAVSRFHAQGTDLVLFLRCQKKIILSEKSHL